MGRIRLVDNESNLSVDAERLDFPVDDDSLNVFDVDVFNVAD